MKKIIALVCSVVIMLSFAACGSKECEVCGSTNGTKKYTIQGESGYLCEEHGKLADMASEFANMVK
ncbi:MAG: hypothetical protein IKJ68_10240 [Clostridia bacterium]|nr:hypothetical protein [Clostridia bacterium]